MKLSAIVVAAAVALVAAPSRVAAQRHEGGLLTALQRELDKSTQLLEQFWDSAFGEPREGTKDQESVVVLAVVEEETTAAVALTDEEKAFACRVAVERIDEQAALSRAAKQMTSRLRTPLGRLVTLHFEGETSCEDLETPALVRECRRVAAMDKEIAQFLREGKTHDAICDVVGMLDELMEDAPVVMDPPPLSCKLCMRFVQMVDDAVKQDMAQVQQVREILGDICDSMSVDSMCHTFIKHYDDVVQWLVHGTDPQVVCERLVMCSAVEGDQSNPLFLKLIPSLLKTQDRGDKKCFYCEYFTTLLQIAVQQDEQDMDEIRQFADMICGVLGDNKYCLDYVSKLDIALDDIKKGKTPREICTDLQFCTKAMEVAQYPVSILGDDTQCLFCDYFVTLLEVAIQEDIADVEQVKQYADLVCGMLGDDSICHQYVDKLNAAIDALQKGKKPREICAELKFCTKSQKLALAPPLTVHGDKKCFYCDYFVTILEVVIQEDKADVDQVREFADMICGLLGDDNVCHEYVNKLDIAIDALKKGKKPREICIDLKFCTKKAKAVAHAVNDEKKCLYCDYFVTILEVMIVQDDSNINLVRQYADMICGMLGDDNICHQYVDKFDVIVDELKLGKKPHQICADIKFCTKAQKVALPAPIAVTDDKQCIYCDYFTTILEVALQEDPNDVDAVRLYAEIACGMLGEANVCHQYLDKFNYAIESLKKGQKPREICAAFKYCVGDHPRLSPSAVLSTPSLLKDAMVKHVVSPAVSRVDDCFFCTQVANVMKVVIAQDPAKVSEIRMIADLICKALPAGNKCHAVMHEIDQIIDSIRKGEEPSAICRDMKFCPKAVESILLPTPISGVKNNDCAYCDGVVTVLEYALKAQPDQVKQMREAAGIVCDFMPKDDKCHEDLKMFDKAIDSLKNGKSPHSVCIDLTLCPAFSTSTTTNPKLMPSSIAKLNMLDAKTLASKVEESEKSMSMGCLLCEYTAEALTFIKGDQSELRLAKQALETMCMVLPPNARCDVLSSKFDNLVQLVTEGKSPSQACNALTLCNAAFVEPASLTQPKPIGAIVAEQ